jgi:hypothetical protein
MPYFRIPYSVPLERLLSDQTLRYLETIPKIALRVGDNTVVPKNGVPFVWDHSYRHSAWNLGNVTRLVLIVDIWHPDLSDAEVKFLGTMQNAKLRVGRQMLAARREEEQRKKDNLNSENKNADNDVDNNLFAIIDKNKGALHDDDWWVLEAESRAEAQEGK